MACVLKTSCQKSIQEFKYISSKLFQKYAWYWNFVYYFHNESVYQFYRTSFSLWQSPSRSAGLIRIWKRSFEAKYWYILALYFGKSTSYLIWETDIVKDEYKCQTLSFKQLQFGTRRVKSLGWQAKQNRLCLRVRLGGSVGKRRAMRWFCPRNVIQEIWKIQRCTENNTDKLPDYSTKISRVVIM